MYREVTSVLENTKKRGKITNLKGVFQIHSASFPAVLMKAQDTVSFRFLKGRANSLS